VGSGVTCQMSMVSGNSVFRRYRRWVTTGVFDAMLETLADLAGRDTAADMIL